MGDMGDMFHDLKEHKKKQRAKNLVNNMPVVSGPSWTKHTDYHYTYQLNGKLLQFWPSKSKWQWDGKIHSGDLAGFIKNRERQ